jgi:hypothetical protein
VPTINPRIQVTVKPSQYVLLQRLAKLQKRSMSKVLSELFDEIEPVYERVAVVLEAASRAQVTARTGMADAFKQAEAEMAPHVAAAMGQFDMLVNTFGHEAAVVAGAPSGARIAAPPSAPTPSPVTRGSGLPRVGGKRRTVHPPRPSITSRKSRRSQGNTPPRVKPGSASVRSMAAAIAKQVRKGPRR